MNIANLKKYIAQNKTDKVLEYLLEVLSNQDNSILNQVIILASQYNQWHSDKILNINNDTNTINRINNALLTIIDSNKKLFDINDTQIELTLINGIKGDSYSLTVEKQIFIKDLINRLISNTKTTLPTHNSTTEPTYYKVFCKELGTHLNEEKTIGEYCNSNERLTITLIPYTIKDYIKISYSQLDNLQGKTYSFVRYYDFKIYQQLLNYIYSNLLINKVSAFSYGKEWFLKNTNKNKYMRTESKYREKSLYEIDIEPQSEILIELKEANISNNKK